LQLFEIAQGKGLELYLGLVVVPPLLSGSKRYLQVELEGVSGFIQGVYLVDGAIVGPGLNPITTRQGIEEDTGPPLEGPRQVVEEALLPKLDPNADPKGEASMDGL